MHGAGEAGEGRFWIDVAGSPPPAAFHQGIAVGEIVLLGAGESVRLGAPLNDVRGLAEGVALVQRAAEIGADAAWAASFPVGLSCAVEGDEGWVPIECAAFGPLDFE